MATQHLPLLATTTLVLAKMAPIVPTTILVVVKMGLRDVVDYQEGWEVS